MRKIKELKQSKREFSAYLAEFMRYAPDVEINLPTNIDYLRTGLSDEVLQVLMACDEPETWDELVTLCQKVDNKLRIYQAEMKSRHPSQHPTANKPNPLPGNRNSCRPNGPQRGTSYSHSRGTRKAYNGRLVPFLWRYGSHGAGMPSQG